MKDYSALDARDKSPQFVATNFRCYEQRGWLTPEVTGGSEEVCDPYVPSVRAVGDTAKSILFPIWKSPRLSPFCGFDRPIPTCYKCPFCAGLPEPETYFSGRISRRVFRGCTGANSDAAKLHHSFRSCGGSVFGTRKR